MLDDNDENVGLKRLASAFSSLVRNRGLQYVEAGRVNLVERTGDVLAADVTGSGDRYRAVFKRQGTDVRYSCSCPHFEREARGCKHLWATALEGAATAMVLNTIPQTRRFVADPNLEWDEQVAEDEPGSSVEDDFEPSEVRELKPQLQVASVPRPSARGVSWEALRSFEPEAEPEAAELHYFIAETFGRDFRLLIGRRKRGAELGPLLPTPYAANQLTTDRLDRELTGLLYGFRDPHSYYAQRLGNLSVAALAAVLPRLAATGRCHLVGSPASQSPEWHLFCEGLGAKSTAVRELPRGYAPLLDLPILLPDADAPWELELVLSEPDARGPRKKALEYEARARFVRGAEVRPLEDVRLAQDSGMLLFSDGKLSSCASHDARWLRSLSNLGHGRSVLVPEAHLPDFLELSFGRNGISRLILPPDFERVRSHEPPHPVIELDAPRGRTTTGRVFFEYDEQRVPLRRESRLLLLDQRKVLERDRALETEALIVLNDAGFELLPRNTRNTSGNDVKINAARLLSGVRALLDAGFLVFAEGKRYRSLTNFEVRVDSGLDWFEVQGSAHFGSTRVPLPQLLKNARAGQIVELGDGSRGVLPSEWLERWGGFAALTPERTDSLHFSTRQIGVAEAMLEALNADELVPGLAELREKVAAFQRVTELEPPEGFLGALRPYQAHGYSWLGALSELSVGACLADDMGLGKTIQVLAHLSRLHARLHESRPAEGRRAPSLIVMPRSLLANWRAEAARFAPNLRIHTHWGPDRSEVEQVFHDVDVVLTTYGTLRLDIAQLVKFELSTVVLDEAQAIKNDASATAKCARQLRAEHRIALSGTPIENHLGELWSLFEFLNPGMLSELPELGRALDKGQAKPETLKLIQRVLKPFVLRRTKQEVAKDLPARSEQTLFVELEPSERKHYEELLRFYQASIKKQGLSDPARSTPQVLEALLRLRQAACHPGLIDRKRSTERSSKLELLLEQLRGVLEEGHKALVFSQFTSLLAILRERLQEEGIAFEYLDGKTKDREACVSRFQNDPELPVFLVSLKAGGVGLNLTAADYVFILDPWWNPAVEAQAIDRAHRIGQTRPVIAYRLLARNTVEERVLQLQDQKRQLVAAVMGDEGAFAGKLTRSDLESLLDLEANRD
ncbi:MAG TPA: SNF2-related protein [Polyangiaceae bacterium]|nr:SNF2-related protein [Polyangiaceae bacterium]